MISLKKLIKSFGYALHGLRLVLQSGQNIKIHLVAAVAAITGGALLKIAASEWLVLLLCIGLVIALEIINTCIEQLCDFISPQYHDKIKIIKDLAAAAVLVAAITSAIIGFIIFIPKFG